VAVGTSSRHRGWDNPQLLLLLEIFGYVPVPALAFALLKNDAGLEQSEQFGYLVGE
jgi:hypothetical protein